MIYPDSYRLDQTSLSGYLPVRPDFRQQPVKQHFLLPHLLIKTSFSEIYWTNKGTGMLLRLVIVLSVLLSGVLCGEAEDAKLLADANTDFAWRFYKAVADESGNIIFSPYSISTALAMTSRGAAHNTLGEMYRALGYADIEETDAVDMNMKLLKVLNADGNQYNTSVANQLYGEQTIKFKQDFQVALRDKFDAFLEKVDFKKNPEESRVTINDWVAEKTNDKITDLLSQGAVTSDTVLYLVNAIYFGARWRFQFEKHKNVDEDFHVSNSETKQVTYMIRNGRSHNYLYAELSDLDAKLLELSYTDPQVAMYVLLPNAIEGLETLEARLKASDLSNSNMDNIFSKLNGSVQVRLRLPKFEMKLSIHPKEILANMGVTEAFTNGADFSRITDIPMKISDVVHKAFIKVFEEGTEAAAATGVSFTPVSLDPAPVKEFHANHPFLYFIREKTTGSILFMGRYVAPPGEGGELPRVGEVNYQVGGDASFTSKSFSTILLCIISALAARIV